MKKSIICIVCLIIGLLILPGCTIAGTTSADDLSIEYGMTLDSGGQRSDSTGIVITNNSDKAAVGVEVKYIPYDENGEQIVLEEGDPASSYMSGKAEGGRQFGTIMPGESVAEAFSISENCGIRKAPDHFEVKVIRVGWKDPESLEDKGDSEIKLSDINYDNGLEEVHMTIRNDTEFDYDNTDPMSGHDLSINAVFRDADGKIIGGDVAWPEFVPADSEDNYAVYFSFMYGNYYTMSPAEVEFFPARVDFTEEELRNMEVVVTEN